MMSEEQLKEIALRDTRADGCRCDPEFVITYHDDGLGNRITQIEVIHQDGCPFLMQAMAPWN